MNGKILRSKQSTLESWSLGEISLTSWCMGHLGLGRRQGYCKNLSVFSTSVETEPNNNCRWCACWGRCTVLGWRGLGLSIRLSPLPPRRRSAVTFNTPLDFIVTLSLSVIGPVFYRYVTPNWLCTDTVLAKRLFSRLRSQQLLQTTTSKSTLAIVGSMTELSSRWTKQVTFLRLDLQQENYFRSWSRLSPVRTS